MPLLRRRAVFAAKTETTIGTAESLTGAEGVYNARDFMIQPNVAFTRREGQGGFNHLTSIPEGMTGTCTIVHDLSYDGTTIPSWASVLLPACGWVDTAGTFSPVSAGPGASVKTLTIGHYKDGKRSAQWCNGHMEDRLPDRQGGLHRIHVYGQIQYQRNRHGHHSSDVSDRFATAFFCWCVDMEQRCTLHFQRGGGRRQQRHHAGVCQCN